MRFEHPSNGYIKDVDSPGAYTLLFGPLYFLSQSIWTHAVISAVLAFGTVGLSWLFYPFAAQSIVRNAYLSRGWKEIQLPPRPPRAPIPRYVWTRLLWCALAIALLIVAAVGFDWYYHPEFYRHAIWGWE